MRHAVALIWLSNSLTKITLFTKFVSILFRGQPPEPTLPDFLGCGVASMMPTRDSVVSFLKYGVFLELSNYASPDVVRGFVIQGIRE